MKYCGGRQTRPRFVVLLLKRPSPPPLRTWWGSNEDLVENLSHFGCSDCADQGDRSQDAGKSTL